MAAEAITPLHLQGRVAATLHFTGMGLGPVGSLLGGLAGSALGPRTTLALAAAGILLSPLCLLISPLARIGRVLPR